MQSFRKGKSGSIIFQAQENAERVLSSRRNLSSADRRGTCTVCTVRMNRKILRIKKSLWRIKKNRMRFFKLNRMRNITVLNVPVLPDAFEGLSDETAGTYDETGEIQFVRLTLKVSKSAVYRIMDEYSVESIEDTEDGTKIITLSLPEIYWLTYYLISFGTELEVLAPQKIRNNIAEEIRRINELYENKI